MSRVEWPVLDGGQVETVLATCIYIEHPRSNRIRPSQGDFGIDVLTPLDLPATRFDVWQIKRFAMNLATSEKRQIEKSFQRVLLALVRRGIALRNWYLVIPLDPTIENRIDWFDAMPEKVFAAMKADKNLELTEVEAKQIRAWLDNPATEVAWKGLDYCESLVSAHPEVPDYFLHGGEKRLRDAVGLLGSILKRDQSLTSSADATAILQPVEIADHLRTVQSALDGDPHFRYGFQVEPHRNEIHSEPGIVAATQTTLADGQTLTYRIYARFDEALNERPIPVRLEFAFDDLTFDQKAYEDWRDYGSDFEGPAILDVDLPGGLASPGRVRVRIVSTRSPNFQRRYRLTSPDGRKLAELTFDCSTTTGANGHGARVTGTDASGLLHLEYRGDLAADQHAVSFNADLIEGIEVLRAAPVVEFLAAMVAPNRLQLSEGFGGRFVDIHPVPVSEAVIHPLVASWVHALTVVQDHVSEPILLPPIDSVTKRDAQEAIDAAAILEGQTVVSHWDSVEIADIGPELQSGPAQLEMPEQLVISVGGNSLDLGLQIVTLLSAQVTIEGKAAHVVPLNNNTVHRRRYDPAWLDESSARDAGAPL